MRGNPLKIGQATFFPNIEQKKEILELLGRLGQIPTNYSSQIQQNTTNISQNLQRIKNKKVSTPLDLSRLDQDQFEWLRFNRNGLVKHDINYGDYTRNTFLLTDDREELHGTIIENIDFDVDQIDSGLYDDGFIIFLYFNADGVKVANDLGYNGHVVSSPFGAYAANIDLADCKNEDEKVIFNKNDYLMLQYDEPARIWREIGRNRATPTAKNVTGTYVTSQDESITADTSSGAVTIRINNHDYVESHQLIIADTTANASTNNITVKDDNTGTTLTTISKDDGYLILYCDGSNFYTVSELQDTSSGTSTIEFIDVLPQQNTISIGGIFGTAGPIETNFMVISGTSDLTITDFERSYMNPGSLLRVKFSYNGASEMNIYSSSSTGILLQGNDYFSVNNTNQYTVEDGEEKLFIFNGTQFRELVSDNQTLYGHRIIGVSTISFWRNALNQAGMGSSNGVNQIQNLSRSLVEVTGTVGSIDPTAADYPDGAVVTIQFGGRSRVNHNAGSVSGKILLDASADTLFFSRDQLTLMYHAGNDEFREIGRKRTSKRETFDGSSGSPVMTNGEDIIYGDTNSQSFDIEIIPDDEFEGRKITVIDTGGNAGTNAIGINTGSTASISGSAGFTINTNYNSVTILFDGTNWNII